MRWISISQAKPGLVLGEPVLDLNGRMLAKKGDCLSVDLIARLHAAGVTDLLAAETGQTLAAPNLAESPQNPDAAEITGNIRKRLDLRFRRHQGNPIMQTIRTLAEKQLIQAKLSQRTS